MKRHSFFIKLFLGNLLLVVVIIVLAGLLAYHWLKDSSQCEGEARQHHVLQIARQHFETIWSDLPDDRPARRASVHVACRRMMARTSHGLRVTVMDREGWVLGDSDPKLDPAKMANHQTRDRPEVLDALLDGFGRDVRRSESRGIEFRYFALPIHYNGRVAGVVRVAMRSAAIVEGRQFIGGALLWAAGAAGVAAVALGLLISWLWYAPLRQITHAARKIASGSLSHRAHMFGSKELADLAGALNEMRESLASQIETIAAQRESLQTVVSNLSEGLIALDADDRIALINKRAVELVAAPGSDLIGRRRLQEAVRVGEIIELYDHCRAANESISRTIEIDAAGERRSIDVLSAIVPPGSSNIAVLLVLRDVTELARTATMKVEFVANASHELRTPLAVIRTAVDSLLAADPDDSESLGKFVEILDRHVTRLQEMTNDLLDLHATESPRTLLHYENADVLSLVDWALRTFGDAASEKGLTLRVEPPDGDMLFRTDRRFVEMIVGNLIDNAIKFTPAGGLVECAFDPKDEGIVIRITDTGRGIRPEDQARIFERFYQTDTSRGGDIAVRGTGLGLSIVKHAAERLGGQVSVESEVDKGTTVTVCLPIDLQTCE